MSRKFDRSIRLKLELDKRLKNIDENDYILISKPIDQKQQNTYDFKQKTIQVQQKQSATTWFTPRQSKRSCTIFSFYTIDAHKQRNTFTQRNNLQAKKRKSVQNIKQLGIRKKSLINRSPIIQRYRTQKSKNCCSGCGSPNHNSTNNILIKNLTLKTNHKKRVNSNIKQFSPPPINNYNEKNDYRISPWNVFSSF